MDSDSANRQPVSSPRGPVAKPPVLERLGIPKGVALAMGAGLLGVFVGGALVGFTAAVVVPAVRSRLARRKPDQGADQPPQPGGTAS